MVQFVPLKVETAGETWGKWAQRYPPDGNGIPIIYVIRADGEKMYGKTGALNGEALPALMQEALVKAGRVLSEQDATALAAAVEAAKKALDEKDTAGAIKALIGAKKIGGLGNSGSYAKAAIEADKLAKQLVELGKTQLEEAKSKLSGDDVTFEAAVAMVEVGRTFALLPELKAPIGLAVREVNRNAKAKELMDQAEAIDHARSLAQLPGGKSRAVSALKLVMTKYADSPAAKLAQEELSKLDGDAAGEAASGTKPAPTHTAGTASSSGSTASGEKKAASYLRMARTFAASRPEKAREYAEKAIEAAPDSAAGREAKELLEQLK